MKQVEECLRMHNYSNEEGYFSTAQCHQNRVAADEIWSALAEVNPISAAAATQASDPFAKYPHLVEAEMPHGSTLALDAGCGYGRVAIPLLRRREELNLVAVDASSVMLNHFLALLAEEDAHSEMKQRLILLHCAIDRLPFDAGTFDCIYSSAVLLHNPYVAAGKILAEFHRLLRPNGKAILVASFPNSLNPEGIQNYLYLKLLDESTRNGPVRVYTRKRVLALFDQWSDVRVIPSGATAIPRHIANIPLPFGASIRRFNEWIVRRDLAFVSKTSLLVKFFDVVALK